MLDRTTDGTLEEEPMRALTVIDHPLVAHKVACLRDENVDSWQFRGLVRELATFETYEATRDIPTEDIDVRTPLAVAHCRHVSSKTLAVVPILRAGMGMLDGVLDAVPTAAVGHLGMERDEETHVPREYYAKMPADIAERIVLLVDPMLATGGSAVAAIQFLRGAGVKDIRLLVMVAAPEGVRAVHEADGDVHIYTCALDDGLNEDAYILPGLGDAGDRIYGTLG